MAELFSKIVAGLQGFKAGFQGQYQTQSGQPPWSPGEPQATTEPAGTQPLQWQYPWGYNLRNAPRPDEPVSFAQLRALADNYDLLRLAIETRKDQMESLDWTIVPKNRKDKSRQADIDLVTELFRRPDRNLPFRRWLRALLEDMLVIDAPSIYLHKNRGGGIYSLDLVDGATIKPIIDQTGRKPAPPLPAYQQVLYGLPAIPLTTEELLYMPRNVRTHKVYGFGNVEQIIMTVNIALRRQCYQLGYYTEGNVPDAFISCPESWGVQQVIEFQAYWDSLFSANTNIRRRARFIPNGTNPVFPKDNPLKDEYDEWLARIIAYCFNLPPTALVKETNRATAETTQEAGKAEGLTPLRNYVKELMDLIIQDYMGLTEVEFAWSEEEVNDPLKQAQVNQIYVGMMALTPDEVREQIGWEPMTEEQKESLRSMQAASLFSSMNQAMPGEEPPDDEAVKLAKRLGAMLAKRDPPRKADPKQLVMTQSSALLPAQKKLATVIQKFFKKVSKDMAQQVSERYQAAIVKADDTKTIVERILKELDFSGWDILYDDVQPILEEIAKASGAKALAQVRVKNEKITELVNKDAVEYARRRAAEMVGRAWVDGELIDNPNAQWAITESTRGYLRSNITQAVEEGWSPQALADHLAENTGFSYDRADNIARTEVATAHTQGNLTGWKRSGVVQGKQSILADTHDYEDECDVNAAAGVIPIDEPFPSGDDGPPYHPRCTCVVVPVVDMEEDGNT